MKRYHCLCLVLVAGALLPLAAARAEQDVTNRLTFSARFGFNITAKFKGFSGAGPLPGPARSTPLGETYNYDDGYAGGVDGLSPDISGNYGGETWYWGYDDSASQIAGNTILLSRTTSAGAPASAALESEPYLGGELAYNRKLGQQGNLNFGIEAAVNYMDFGVHDNSSPWIRETHAYPFTPGTTPPTATPSGPYQGSYEGPGFVIGTNYTTSITSLGGRRLDTDIWGFRLGPYFETPLCKRMNLSVAGGLAAGLLDNTVSWTQTGSSVRASDFDAVWGWFVRANVAWHVSKRWDVVGGVQFQDLGIYRHNFAGQEVELNLRNSLFLTAGLSYCF